MTASTLEPFHSPAKTGRPLNVYGDKAIIRVSAKDSGGAFSVVDLITPAGVGPPLHVHHREHETFRVVEGEYEFHVAGEVIRGGPGSTVLAPRDIPHWFQNVSDKPGFMIVTLVPGGFEGFFEEVDQAAPDGFPNPETGAALGKKYGLEFL